MSGVPPLCILLLLALPGAAVSAPPKRAKIRPGVGMAGVRLGQRVRVVKDRSGVVRLRGKAVSRWGPVDGFCFEGDLCSWKVSRGGQVSLLMSPPYTGRVRHLFTTARGWRTPSGIHPGSRQGSVRRAYPSVRRDVVCLGPYGGEYHGLISRRRRSTMLFVLKRERVSQIVLLAYRLPQNASC